MRAEPLVRRYFDQLAFTPDSVSGWIEGRGTGNYINERHDRAVGWVPVEGTYRHGLDGSLTCYSYDPSGARRMVHQREQPCRINTYGDSFTHCDQVNDGETWQEVLARPHRRADQELRRQRAFRISDVPAHGAGGGQDTGSVHDRQHLQR